jgi:hypothetical protein
VNAVLERIVGDLGLDQLDPPQRHAVAVALRRMADALEPDVNGYTRDNPETDGRPDPPHTGWPLGKTEGVTRDARLRMGLNPADPGRGGTYLPGSRPGRPTPETTKRPCHLAATRAPNQQKGYPMAKFEIGDKVQMYGVVPIVVEVLEIDRCEDGDDCVLGGEIFRFKDPGGLGDDWEHTNAFEKVSTP